MISIDDTIRLVLKTMLEKKGRVFLTIAGIIIGIFTFTFFIFASQGLSNAISEQFTAFGVNVLTVRPADASSGGPPSGSGLTDSEVARIKQVTDNVKYVAPSIFYTGLYTYDRERRPLTTLAYPDEFLDEVQEDLGIDIAEGRYLRSGDSGVVVLGAKTAEDTFSDTTVDVGTSIKTENQSFRVIGIIEEQGDLFIDNSMLMPFDDLKEVAGQNTYSSIRISFFENADLDRNKEAIERQLNPNNDEKEVRVESAQQAIDQFNQILGVLQLIISFISSIALLVGGINVMNTMYSNVLERINEISVMKAMGGTNEDIRNLFLVESAILGVIGALLGFFLSYGLAEFLSYVVTGLGYNVPINFDVTFFIAVISITTLFSTIFGTYPALKAAYINPADNLRDE